MIGRVSLEIYFQMVDVDPDKRPISLSKWKVRSETTMGAGLDMIQMVLLLYFSFVPRTPPSFLLLAVQKAGWGLGMRLL